jgi:hypothetical protein
MTSPNWYDAFPAPSHTADLITRDVALSKLSSPELLLVDVRRTDYEGGTIKGSLNIPAQSFFLNRRALYDLCKRAGVKQVAFYCGKILSLIIQPRRRRDYLGAPNPAKQYAQVHPTDAGHGARVGLLTIWPRGRIARYSRSR